MGELRAIARFPEPDYIFWLVAEELDIHSMEELAARKPAVTLVSGRVGPTGPDTLTWTVEQVMKWYGFSYEDVNSWGGQVLFPGPAIVGVPMVRRGEGNAVFQEGSTTSAGRNWPKQGPCAPCRWTRKPSRT